MMEHSIRCARAWFRRGSRRLAALALAVTLTVAGAAAAVLAGRPQGAGAHDRAPAADSRLRVDRADALASAARVEVDLAAETLRRYALNLLLLPLLEEDLPLRWTRPEPQFTCLDPDQVRVDGQPVVAGARLPGGSFVVEGHLSSCRVLEPDDLDVTGAVTLRVFPDDVLGLTAIVELRGLRIRSPAGATVVLDDRFAAGAMRSGDDVTTLAAR